MGSKTDFKKRSLKVKTPLLNKRKKLQLIITNQKISKTIQEVLQEFHFLRKTKSIKLTKKEKKKPFEDTSSLELLSRKLDASLFIYGSHSKKRPHNLIFGRMFDYQILDMFEIGVNEKTFKTSFMLKNGGYSIGTYPIILFCGESFHNNSSLRKLRNLFLDILKGEKMSVINVSKLDRAIVITAISNKKILFRQYKINKHKGLTIVPQIEIKEIGPSIDFTFRRYITASEELQILAYQNPKKIAKTKNITQNKIGERLGRIYLKHQDLDEIIKLSLKKTKAFRRYEKKK